MLVDERLQRGGRLAWAMLGLTGMLIALGVVAWWVRVIWPPLILAGAIVFLLNPVVSALQSHRVPRPIGVALSYLAFFTVVGLAGFGIVPLAADQADELSGELPELRGEIEQGIDDLAARSQGWILQLPSSTELEDSLGGGGEGDADVGEQLATVREVGRRIFDVAIILFLAPIIAFYLLVDLPRLRVVAEGLVPAKAKDEVMVVAHRLNRAIGGFFRGQLFVAAIVGLMISIGLFAIDLPFWLIIGLIAGLFNLIPLIGPYIGAIPGVVIALTTRDVGTAIWVVVIMAGAQQVDNHLISPLVMQRAVKLHPAAVMLALLAGGTIGGLFGLLLAVPTAAVLKIVAGHLWRTYVLEEPLEQLTAEAERADAAPGSGVIRDITVGPAEVDLEPDGASSQRSPDERQPHQPLSAAAAGAGAPEGAASEGAPARRT